MIVVPSTAFMWLKLVDPVKLGFTSLVKIQLFLQQPTINLMPVFRQPKNNRNSGGDYALNLLNIKSRQDKPYPYFNT